MKYTGTKINDESVVNMETLKTELASLVNASPSYISALNQLASAIASNSSIMSAITQAIADKASKEELDALEAKYRPLVLSGAIAAGEFTQEQMDALGFTSLAVENILLGTYTKVIQTASYTQVWSYEAYQSSSMGTIIVLRGAVTSYKISKGRTATTWKIATI